MDLIGRIYEKRRKMEKGLFLSQEAPLSIRPATELGTQMEKVQTGNGTKWRYFDRLNKTGADYNYETSFEIPAHYEIKRLIAGLDIHHNGGFLARVQYNVGIYYSQMPFGSGSRNVFILSPVALYITGLESFIFINIHALYGLMECKKRQFVDALYRVYRKNKQLYNHIHSDEFRKQYVYNLFLGLKNQFGYPDEFLGLAGKLLSTHFEGLKNRKDTVVAVLLFARCKEFMGRALSTTYTEVCGFLGVSQSVINNNKDLWRDNKDLWKEVISRG